MLMFPKHCGTNVSRGVGGILQMGNFLNGAVNRKFPHTEVLVPVNVPMARRRPGSGQAYRISHVVRFITVISTSIYTRWEIWVSKTLIWSCRILRNWRSNRDWWKWIKDYFARRQGASRCNDYCKSQSKESWRSILHQKHWEETRPPSLILHLIDWGAFFASTHEKYSIVSVLSPAWFC